MNKLIEFLTKIKEGKIIEIPVNEWLRYKDDFGIVISIETGQGHERHYFKPIEKAQTNFMSAERNRDFPLKAEESLDKYFPKGRKFRGPAMLIMAEAYWEGYHNGENKTNG